MWLMVMFDLPVVTKPERRAATEFRASLRDLGFEMSQYSVYLRFCASQSLADTQTSLVKALVPHSGRVSILSFTDRQFQRTITFNGRAKVPTKKGPEQLEIF